MALKIEQKGDNEFELTGLGKGNNEECNAWLTVGKASLEIKLTDEGLVVDIFRLDHEDEGSIGSTYVFDSELEDDHLDDDRDPDNPVEFTESPEGERAREKWAERYDELDGAPENDGDR